MLSAKTRNQEEMMIAFVDTKAMSSLTRVKGGNKEAESRSF